MTSMRSLTSSRYARSVAIKRASSDTKRAKNTGMQALIREARLRPLRAMFNTST